MKLFSFTGPSGIGKGFLKRISLERFPFITELMWVTTRPLRKGEASSGNRRTVSQEEFLGLESENKLALVQKLGDHYYGLEAYPMLKERLSVGFFLTELHVDNVLRIKSSLDIDPISIGLFPSNVDFLRYRLEKRNSESPQEIERRLAASVEEVKKMESMRAHFSFAPTISRNNEAFIHHGLLIFLESHIKQHRELTN